MFSIRIAFFRTLISIKSKFYPNESSCFFKETGSEKFYFLQEEKSLLVFKLKNEIEI